MLHVWGTGVELERERRVRRVAAAFAALAFPAAAVLLPAFVLLPITRPPIHRGQAVAMGFDSVKSRMHLPMWLLWAIATISALLGWYVQAAISRTSHSSNVSAPCLHMHMPLALMLHHTNAPRSHYNSHTYTRSPDSQVPLIHRVFGSSLKINHFNVRMLTMHRCVQLSSTPPPPPPPPPLPLVLPYWLDRLACISWFRIGAAERELGYTPIVRFSEGWADTLVWFREFWLPTFTAGA